MNKNNPSIDQAIQAYRVLNTPTKYSYRYDAASMIFDSPDLIQCPQEQKDMFFRINRDMKLTVFNSISSKTGGQIWDVRNFLQWIVSPDNKSTLKANRKVVYSTSNGIRPVGKEGFEIWSGWQVIDMDIKNEDIARKLKTHIFNALHKCNWFLGVVLSSSHSGLHVYTKIQVPESDQNDYEKIHQLFLVNFRHKYSFVYLACTQVMEEIGYCKSDILSWLDKSMNKPQQGAFIPYDDYPLINSGFFEDYIYVNFDNVEDIGSPEVDWVTHPDLKPIFSRVEYMSDLDTVQVNVLEKPELEFDMHNKVHYKYNERWRLANTLVKLYGYTQGFAYLRMIVSNNVRDNELRADCNTARLHEKPVDIWAVNRLNSAHGFKIKIDVETEEFDESAIVKAVDKIDNPTLIHASKHTKTYNINKDQYLGHIRHKLMLDLGRVTLLEAGAGVGKTEMVKQIVREDGKKIMMVMPFTSTIKAKTESDKDWEFSYGNRKPNLNVTGGLSLTVDKFSHLNPMDIKTAGFDYIFIDESHLLFQSEYRPVMSKVIELVRHIEIPTILMSGTPSGELVFFPDIVHIKVIKEDIRKKEFNVNLVDTPSELIFHMCRQMANDICDGKRILFPTNSGTLYSKQIKAAVTYFMQNEHVNFDEVRLYYYKKSNVGEKFMDDVNLEKTIGDCQILLCSNYLSVGVDILDRWQFSIYFADLMMPQEVEQFANRLRSNDLFINCYVSKNDADGNTRSLHKYRDINFKLNDEELKNVHSILRLCNAMIERNPIEYRYNSFISSLIQNNKFIEYNDIDNKYYLNEITYKVIQFERKYREYVQQLPVLMKGMEAYGYQISAKDLGGFQMEGQEVFRDLKDMVKLAYDEQLQLNTKHIEELMDIISEDRLPVFKDVLAGKYDIRKGDVWKHDILKQKMTVKNIEVFEKVVPIFISLSKKYKVTEIRKIFEHCRNKNGSFNFAAIQRLRMLVNILYNAKKNRLDLPIKEFMGRAYDFCDKGTVKKYEIAKFISDFVNEYAKKESTNEIIIPYSTMAMETMANTFEKIFKCLVQTSRPNKQQEVSMSRVELLWEEREYYNSENQAGKVIFLQQFLDSTVIDTETVDNPIVE